LMSVFKYSCAERHFKPGEFYCQFQKNKKENLKKRKRKGDAR
jgi:hypothetical protein